MSGGRQFAPATTWPSVEQALEIHARLCQDDPVAPSELALGYLEPLAAWLERTNPRIDPHLCQQAAGDAIITLARNPHTFDPEKSPLDAYLRMSARGDLRNLLAKESRHHARRADFEDVELFGAARNPKQEETDPALIVEREDVEQQLLEALAPTVERAFTREEAAVLELLLQGERRTSAFAGVLGISELSEIEQRGEVKRIKDRIKRRLQRARGQT